MAGSRVGRPHTSLNCFDPVLPLHLASPCMVVCLPSPAAQFAKKRFRTLAGRLYVRRLLLCVRRRLAAQQAPSDPLGSMSM